MASWATVERIQDELEQVTPTAANLRLLQRKLDRATGIVRDTMRALLADPTFDYVAYGAASTKIIRGHAGSYLTLPPHQEGSVTLVEYQSGTNPATYSTLADQYLVEGGAVVPRWGLVSLWVSLPCHRRLGLWADCAGWDCTGCAGDRRKPVEGKRPRHVDGYHRGGWRRFREIHGGAHEPAKAGVGKRLRPTASGGGVAEAERKLMVFTGLRVWNTSTISLGRAPVLSQPLCTMDYST